MISLIFACAFAVVALFDDNDKPVPALEEILTFSQKFRPSDKKLESKKDIRDYLITKWCYTINGSFDPPSRERNEFSFDQAVSKQQKDKLYENFKKLGMVNPYEPAVTEDITLIVSLGGHYDTMLKRFDYAKDFFLKAKNSCKNLKIAVIAGDRPLNKKKDPSSTPLDVNAPNNLKTESDIGHYIAAKNPDLPVVVLTGPNQTKLKKRGSTTDRAITLKNWLSIQDNMENTTIVIVSSQPLTQYMLAAFEKVFKGLPYTFKILAVPPPFLKREKSSFENGIDKFLGSEPALNEQDIAVLMDTLARTISILSN